MLEKPERVTDTEEKKDVCPCLNKDHTATNIPHTNVLKHLITEVRVNHAGDCETQSHPPPALPPLFTDLHHFYSYLG